MQFDEKKRNCCRKLNVCQRVDAHSTIVGKYPNHIFKLKKSISIKNLDSQFALKKSVNKDLTPLFVESKLMSSKILL